MPGKPLTTIKTGLATGSENPDSKSDADWVIYQRMKPLVQKIRRKHYAVDTSQDITPVLDKIIRETRR